MGKPSSTQLSKKTEMSIHSNRGKPKMNVPMSLPKVKASKRKNKNKTKRNIKKVFDQLRNESNLSQNSSPNASIVFLESTTTLTSQSNGQKPGRSKRRRRSLRINEMKRRKTTDSLIVINDDDLVTNNEPCDLNTPRKSAHINCSTPIVKNDKITLENLIINNFSKSNNNINSVQNFNEDVINLTREINRDSYLTIDLTADSDLNKSRTQNTVIDLINASNASEAHDCTVVSVSNASMSGDSDVTVLKYPTSSERQLRRFANGIDQLNASAKGKLLELITEKILSGCSVPSNVKSNLANIKEPISRATETAEDTFIKEVILGETASRNSVGSNIYHPGRDSKNKCGLRMVVIDGSNVAMEHGKGKVFSVKGLKICIDYFVRRGHVVKAFVPRFRCKFRKSTEPRLLDYLERQGLVVYTPSREIQGKNITPYDDRYIIQCAAEFDGVIVSGDNYRDLAHENPKWRFVIENRLLPFTWVNDMIMFPEDPLGRNGPTLKQFLSHPNQSAINNLFVNF